MGGGGGETVGVGKEESGQTVKSKIGESTEYIFYCKRAILFLSSSKILTPHPPLPLTSLSSPRNKGGGYTLAGRTGGEGDGGSIFWKTREIGLSSYSKICTLWVKGLTRRQWKGDSGETRGRMFEGRGSI